MFFGRPHLCSSSYPAITSQPRALPKPGRAIFPLNPIPWEVDGGVGAGGEYQVVVGATWQGTAAEGKKIGNAWVTC